MSEIFVMDNKELRIGNIVCLIDRSSEIHLPIEMFPYVISEIGMFHTKMYPLSKGITQVEHIKVDLNDVSPITLTEEWLLKFGFLISFSEANDYDFVNGDFGIYQSSDGSFNFELPDEHGGLGCQVMIKYVHKLQNIYFELIGEELELNKTELTS